MELRDWKPNLASDDVRGQLTGSMRSETTESCPGRTVKDGVAAFKPEEKVDLDAQDDDVFSSLFNYWPSTTDSAISDLYWRRRSDSARSAMSLGMSREARIALDETLRDMRRRPVNCDAISTSTSSSAYSERRSDVVSRTPPTDPPFTTSGARNTISGVQEVNFGPSHAGITIDRNGGATTTKKKSFDGPTHHPYPVLRSRQQTGSGNTIGGAKPATVERRNAPVDNPRKHSKSAAVDATDVTAAANPCPFSRKHSGHETLAASDDVTIARAVAKCSAWLDNLQT